MVVRSSPDRNRLGTLGGARDTASRYDTPIAS